jgi:hypothetical protein
MRERRGLNEAHLVTDDPGRLCAWHLMLMVRLT